MTVLYYALGALYVLLAGAWAFSRYKLPDDSPSKAEILARIKTWGWILLFLLPVFIAPKPWPQIFLGLVSFLAFKEFITLTPARNQDRWAFLWAYVAIPLQYLWAGMGWYGMFIIFIPVYLFLFLPSRMVLAGHPKGFLRATATLHWGLMTTVYSLSHMAYLLALPEKQGAFGPVSGAALLFLLIFLTQINDVAQFVWGKTLGKHPVLPLVSPKKTWEGLLGGIGTAVLLTVLLGPVFSPLTPLYAAGLGLIIGTFGFLGDVVMSAVKRDIGVKNSGTLLPGHGGILDRLDSLTFTAPLYFHILYYLYY
ncbi:phosphatidate cytidylyltransferase [Desulfosarcina sp. OttesenSCG-928-G10]|nr:phosphatidate cytidylyltransferase [Desulfosarcina sp. OttesenSCG-928-G10]MDL2321706.1 phosphatidate cytidylyltransferase [Desulfosarcina sp. OttesenSCG-928-B08]